MLRMQLGFWALLLLMPFSAPAQICVPDTPLHTIFYPDIPNSHRFGISAAISGDTAVVGSLSTVDGFDTAGTAFLMDPITGAIRTSLYNPAIYQGSRFGEAVAISGDLVIVAARGYDPGGASLTGAVYSYNAMTGAFVSVMHNPEPAAHDSFGFAVALSGDAAVIGAYGDAPWGAGFAGSAYIFNARTGELTATLKDPLPAAPNYFGSAVAISGKWVTVSSDERFGDGYHRGSVYVFDSSTGDLIRELRDPAPDRYRNFGLSLSSYGSLVAVGAPASQSFGSAHIFNASTGSLIRTLTTPVPDRNDRFGESVSIYGSQVLVSSGEIAYLFDAMTGALLSELTNVPPSSVALSSTTAIVGASRVQVDVRDAGVVYTFACSSPLKESTLDYILAHEEQGSLDSNGDQAIDVADLISQ